MLFTSYIEFAYILIFIIAFNALRWVFPSLFFLKRFFFLAGSLAIISTIINLDTIFVLILLMVGSYGMGQILLVSNIPASKRKKILTVSLSFIILLFCVRNYIWFGKVLTYIGLESTMQSISLVGRVGLSYILFRLLHFLVDAYRGKINHLRLITFLNYIFFFPTFLSGPIDRYNNFMYWEGTHRPMISLNMIYQGSARVFIGAVKKALIVPLILPYVNELSNFESITNIWQLQMLLTVLAYTFYIYFDFSGYSDIAIGTAYLIGIKTPENFNNPYFSKDIAEFWKKWHISFSSILGEYVFKPIVVGLSQRFKSAPRLSISVAGYLITFVICGLWHGSTLNFVYWGLWHGVGLAIYKIWDSYKQKRYPANGTFKLFKSSLAITITFIFVSLGWYFFMTGTQEIHSVIKNEIPLLNKEYKSGNEVELSMSNHHWDGYGWGVSMSFQVHNKATIEIQYRKIDEHEWIITSVEKEAGLASTQIHGITEHAGNKRNLDPGLYVVRLKTSGSDEWFGGIVQVRNYKEENES